MTRSTPVWGAISRAGAHLWAHLTTLEVAGYVAISKAFESKRPKTTATATAAGRKAYRAHVAALRSLIGGK